MRSFVSARERLPFYLLYDKEALGTDKIPSRPVAVSKNGARVLPLKVVPVPGHRQKIMFRLVAVPENQQRAPSLNEALGNVHTSTWATDTKYKRVQTGNRCLLQCTDILPEFLRGYLIKGCVHISDQ